MESGFLEKLCQNINEGEMKAITAEWIARVAMFIKLYFASLIFSTEKIIPPFSELYSIYGCTTHNSFEIAQGLGKSLLMSIT